VSRARCFAVVLASPDLFAVDCRTPELMRMLNALWLLVERSRAVGPTLSESVDRLRRRDEGPGDPSDAAR
jgi:hypothetical protein